MRISGLEFRRVLFRSELARSADGTMDPMVIIGQGKATGPQPTLIESYGSYGAYTTRPYYDPFYLAWSARGHNMIYCGTRGGGERGRARSEEQTSELQSLMRISYAVFCLKKKTQNQ